MTQFPRLVFIGRPNVGKSTLFNRLLGKRKALVHNKPGVTRDRNEAKATWMIHGKNFPVILVDTGGLGGEHFKDEISQQVEISLSQADVILLLFDAHSGLTPSDSYVLERIKSTGLKNIHGKRIPIIGVVNKVDAESHESLFFDFYATGLDSLLTVSAEHGRGVEDLKKALYETVLKVGYKNPLYVEESPLLQAPKPVAIVGRPNVGKSTFINALLDEERMITSSIAGTTIDSVDSLAILNGKPYTFIDTAGIRRKDKTEQGIEVLSVVQAKKALVRADVAILLLDGSVGVTDQDEKIGGIIEKTGCSVILAVNKWDTQKDNKKFTKLKAAERIRSQMAYLKYAPLMFMSAIEKQGFDQLGHLIEDLLRDRKLKISTHELTEFLRVEAEIHNPKNAKFYLCHQTSRTPPTFTCHVNDPEKIPFSLSRHLVNAIREKWGFLGCPLRLKFSQGSGGTSRAGKSSRPGKKRRSSKKTSFSKK